MAVAFASIGAGSAGTTSVTPGYNAATAAGDMLILVVVNKYPSNGPATPAGWSLVGQTSGGASTAAVDSGNVYCTVFSRIADGTEPGASTMTVTCASGNSLYARIVRYTKAASEVWGIVGPSIGSCALATTAWSVTGDVPLDVAANDMVLVTSGINTDNYTWTVEAIAIPGVVMGTGTERNDAGTTQGDDCGNVMSDHVVTSGTQAGAPTYTMTASGSNAGVSPAGATVMFRLRAGVPSASSRRRRRI